MANDPNEAHPTRDNLLNDYRADAANIGSQLLKIY